MKRFITPIAMAAVAAVAFAQEGKTVRMVAQGGEAKVYIDGKLVDTIKLEKGKSYTFKDGKLQVVEAGSHKPGTPLVIDTKLQGTTLKVIEPAQLKPGSTVVVDLQSKKPLILDSKSRLRIGDKGKVQIVEAGKLQGAERVKIVHPKSVVQGSPARVIAPKHGVTVATPAVPRTPLTAQGDEQRIQELSRRIAELSKELADLVQRRHGRGGAPHLSVPEMHEREWARRFESMPKMDAEAAKRLEEAMKNTPKFDSQEWARRFESMPKMDAEAMKRIEEAMKRHEGTMRRFEHMPKMDEQVHKELMEKLQREHRIIEQGRVAPRSGGDREPAKVERFFDEPLFRTPEAAPRGDQRASSLERRIAELEKQVRELREENRRLKQSKAPAAPKVEVKSKRVR